MFQVDTDTLVGAAQSANPNASKLPLASMIDTAKKVDTKHYVSGAQFNKLADFMHVWRMFDKNQPVLRI